jgi:16S rRNA (adenine1518-N6/adenine1519-N6)-dimethyltransferase
LWKFAAMYTLKKSLGQHFLRDENVSRKIVDQFTFREGMNLAEIGPGGGALTKYLLQLKDINFKAIEVDTEKVEYLCATYPEIVGKIINEDILKTTKPFDGAMTLIGNFPYNISSQILFRILEWEPDITEVIGMFQKEVGERIASKPGSKVYGILSVLMQAYFETEYLFEVHENCFEPPPKVKSCVLRFKNSGNPYRIDDKRKFIGFVKLAFNQRRKTLRNALKSMLPAHAMSLPILQQRAEQLSVQDFAALFFTIKQKDNDSAVG